MPKMNWKCYLIPLHRLLTRISRAAFLSLFEAPRHDPKQCIFWILHRQRGVKFCTVASWRPLLLHKYFSSPCDAPESVSPLRDAHFSEKFSLQHELSTQFCPSPSWEGNHTVPRNRNLYSKISVETHSCCTSVYLSAIPSLAGLENF